MHKAPNPDCDLNVHSQLTHINTMPPDFGAAVATRPRLRRPALQGFRQLLPLCLGYCLEWSPNPTMWREIVGGAGWELSPQMPC